ncbi:unnamed protein product [Schistosoma curassoni]|uniref:Uncharacterized protein n=1 Tax=Schistosoma curassoni TaxID=6186 RepID=A0A183K5J5_9TREM|nr:unnamed protein product [Schistosoma curassoni]
MLLSKNLSRLSHRCRSVNVLLGSSPASRSTVAL